jgi:acylphosphatase
MAEDGPDPAGSSSGVDTRIRLRARVHGRVQGVWFRGSTEAEALRRGVEGWVRNRPDGSVEAIFEGERAAVHELLEYVRVGPRGARVERVDVTEEPPERERGFRVRS